MADEEINISYLLRQISEKQEQHINASNTFREETKTALNSIVIHSNYTKEAVGKHDKDITILKDAHNQSKWVLRTLSALGLFGAEEFVRNYFFK